MKKSVQSALCSALVVPGLGQVMNKRPVKGLVMMALVFVLVVAITADLIWVIILQVRNLDVADLENIDNLMKRIFIQGDLTTFRVLLAALMVLWIYSIADAFIDGKSLEKETDCDKD